MTEKEIIKLLAAEMNISTGQVERTVDLLDGGNTIPFIARYRKETTGSLDEDVLRRLEERLKYLRNLARRKQEVLRLIDEQGKLTEELAAKINRAAQLQEVEDLYLPFRPKRQTRATKARAKGLEPLAMLLLAQTDKDLNIEEEAAAYLDPEQELNDIEDVLQGCRDIIAEVVTDDADIRKIGRKLAWEQGLIQTEGKTDAKTPYEMYYRYKEKAAKIPPHRVLAINRGEREDYLRVQLVAPQAEIKRHIYRRYLKSKDFPSRLHVEAAIEDGYKRLLEPAKIREIRSRLTQEAEEHAIKVFAANLQNLLMQPPIRDKVVMGIDPAYRTGCKVAVVDGTGRLIDTETIFPHEPQHKYDLARRMLGEVVEEHAVDIMAIGNGTACRETEQLAVEVIEATERELSYVIVDEAGASVYSASPLARNELPSLDVSMRGAVSIARRLLDPLAELVKIDPRSLGVGLYQHDVTPARLKEKLEQVVESCVNHVGVDVNTASPALLRYVAGMNSRLASALVQRREEKGPYQTREEVLAVRGMGAKTYEQAAGFLRLYSEADPLARTPIHPESYTTAERLLARLGFNPTHLAVKESRGDLKEKLEQLEENASSLSDLASTLDTGEPTLKDIIDALKRPGRDPRAGLPKPIFRTNVLTIADLQEGMVLKGTVRNVVDFGAFVDIGVKEDGLVHISQLRDKFIKNPLEVVAVGDVVTVRVINVDQERKRIGLSMKGVTGSE